MLKNRLGFTPLEIKVSLTKLTKIQKSLTGFTVVELLVAIVIIGILATLVTLSFKGVQPKARDDERKTEIEIIASHLEAEFQRNGQYPSVATMTGSVSGVQAVLKGVSSSVLAAPGVAAGTNSIKSFTVAPPTSLAVNEYGYWISTNPPCDSPATYNTKDCGTFILAYKKEVAPTGYVYICVRGTNVNNTKDIFPGPTGMPSFASSDCSNF